MKPTKTISVLEEDYYRLEDFKFESRSRTFREAFKKLLDKAEEPKKVEV